VNNSRLLIALCTYNERENLERLIPDIQSHAPDADILVIDDNSPDGTGRLVETLATRDPRIHLIARPGKLGLGTANVRSYEYAIEHGYDFLLNLDADFSHPPRFIPDLRACMDRADVAIGSRYVPGGGIVGWGLLRHIMSRGVNWYTRLLLRLEPRDCSGSFRFYRVSRLAELDFARIVAHGYAFQEEILYRLRRLGCRFVETPIVFEERRYGSSKINWREVLAALWVILRLGVEGLLRVPVAKRSEGT
jgi:dolichol-phosphate mannosyltransferase